MPISTKTKAVAALGVLDIVRQVATAWSAKHQAEQQRAGFGHGLREDARQALRDARDHVPSRSQFQWGFPPVRRKPTFTERLGTWGPVGLVIVASSAVVIYVARMIARHDETRDPQAVATDSRMVGAIRASSRAIDTGVTKVVDGGSAAAVGTASTVAAGSTAIRAATVDRAKVEVDQRVMRPAKKKAMLYGSLGVMGLTIYVIIIAVVVQLVVGAVG